MMMAAMDRGETVPGSPAAHSRNDAPVGAEPAQHTSPATTGQALHEELRFAQARLSTEAEVGHRKPSPQQSLTSLIRATPTARSLPPRRIFGEESCMTEPTDPQSP